VKPSEERGEELGRHWRLSRTVEEREKKGKKPWAAQIVQKMQNTYTIGHIARRMIFLVGYRSHDL
jgi:hypothetical protein